MSSQEDFNTIVIGGGQAGLAAGYYLSQLKVSYTILDQNSRTGESWRKRWDSLHLFTPSQNNNLPGMKFPKPDFYFPSKDETADFLEAYARHFNLPIRLGVKVEKVERHAAGFHLSAGEINYHADHVIVATGAFHTPRIPDYSSALAPGILQMHSAYYRNPEDFPAQNVLVVGAGNSGAEIAMELARAGKKTWLAGRDVGRFPADKIGRLFKGKVNWWILHRVMSIRTPIGRRMKGKVLNHGNPLIRAKREEVSEAGGEFTGRMAGVVEGKPQLEGGQVIEADGVIWATGFRPEYRWINLPVFDQHGFPRHERGVVIEMPGLYFVGLHFQSRLTSALLGGVGEDAEYICRQLQ
jgi:putative flavoprotein involved in K+ transport